MRAVLVDLLFALGAIFIAFDLVVLRLLLRKRPGHRLVLAGAACLVAAAALLWLVPLGTAH